MTNYESHATHRTLPRVSQETLSELVRTTRSRVNFSMDEFRKLAFIEYNRGSKVDDSPWAPSCSTDRRCEPPVELPSQSQPLKVRANDLVALACGLFELLPLQHPNPSVLGCDEPVIL